MRRTQMQTQKRRFQEEKKGFNSKQINPQAPQQINQYINKTQRCTADRTKTEDKQGAYKQGVVNRKRQQGTDYE